MALMSKLKEWIPWKRKPVDTQEVVSVRNDIDRWFDRVLMSPFETEWLRFPMVGSGIDIEETEEGVIVHADVPGLDPKHLDVTIRNGMLHLSYADQREWRNKHGRGSGRRWTAFHRSLTLPDGLETLKADATCTHGVLTVRIPWTLEARNRSHRIVVSVN